MYERLERLFERKIVVRKTFVLCSAQQWKG